MLSGTLQGLDNDFGDSMENFEQPDLPVTVVPTFADEIKSIADQNEKLKTGKKQII